MRGEDLQQHEQFSYESLEERVPADHPLRPIRTMVDEALKALDGSDGIYDEDSRKSIPPERLLRALLLQMFYTIRRVANATSASSLPCRAICSMVLFSFQQVATCVCTQATV